MTDRKGAFRLAGLTPGPNQTLWVDAEGCVRVRLEHVCVFPNVDVDLGETALACDRPLELRVVDKAGQPIAGASVRARQWYHTWQQSIHADGPIRHAVTNAQGRCALGPFARGSAEFTITAPGYRERIRHSELPRRSRMPWTIVLSRRPRVVRGRVVDERERAIVGARVWDPRAQDDVATSGTDGRYRLDVWSDDARLTAAKPGFSFDAWDLSGTTLMLRPTRWIRGRLLDKATRAPLPITRLFLFHVERAANGRERIGSG